MLQIPKNKKTIFFSAGEVSGDYQGSLVLKELSKNKELFCYGIGGKKMQAEGFHLIFDVTTLNTIGLIEGLRYYFKIRQQVYKKIIAFLDENPPDVAVLIDNQGFNIPLAKKLRKHNTTVLYYFPPPVSIWHENLTKKLKNIIDGFIVPFYDDYLLYKENGCTAFFSGHPLLDTVKRTKPISDVRQELKLQPGQKLIGLLPGSRQQEIYKFLPVMLDAARRLSKEIDIQYLLPVAGDYYLSFIKQCISDYPDLPITLLEELNYDKLGACDLHIMSSGTATLESALLGVPMIILYKIHPITFFIAKQLVQTEHVGLPNILHKTEVAPELLQKDMNSENIYEQALSYLKDNYKWKQTSDLLNTTKNMLGEEGVLSRVAEYIMRQFD